MPDCHYPGFRILKLEHTIDPGIKTHSYRWQVGMSILKPFYRIHNQGGCNLTGFRIYKILIPFFLYSFSINYPFILYPGRNIKIIERLKISCQRYFMFKTILHIIKYRWSKQQGINSIDAIFHFGRIAKFNILIPFILRRTGQISEWSYPVHIKSHFWKIKIHCFICTILTMRKTPTEIKWCSGPFFCIGDT